MAKNQTSQNVKTNVYVKVNNDNLMLCRTPKKDVTQNFDGIESLKKQKQVIDDGGCVRAPEKSIRLFGCNRAPLQGHGIGTADAVDIANVEWMLSVGMSVLF